MSCINNEKEGLEASTTFSAVDLMAMELAEPKWAIDGIIPEGLSILAGNPKLGKSFLALNISIAVASGGLALGEIQVEKGDVHYLALEDSPRRLQERLTKSLDGQPTPDNLIMSIQWPRLNEGGLEQLDQWLKEHSKARLVIVDTFGMVRPINRKSGDVYAEDYQNIRLLKGLADKYSVAILAVHHTNKLIKIEDPIENISGSFGLSGAADGLLIIKRERGRHDASLLVTGRDTPEQQIALKWNERTWTWSCLGEADDYRMSEERATVIRILKENKNPMTPKEIQPLLDKSSGNTRQILSRMLKAGQIGCLGDGKYILQSNSCNESNDIISESVTEDTGATEADNGFDEWF